MTRPATRAVLIGNSHAGAFQLAWDDIGGMHPWLDLDVFAAPLPVFRRFTLGEDRTFGSAGGRGTDMRGRTSIRLADVDVVLWAGYPWQPAIAARLARDFDVDDLRNAGGARLLSRAAFDAVCRSLAEALVPPPAWRGWDKPRLILLPRATPSESCLAGRDPKYRSWRDLARRPAGARDVLCSFLDSFRAVLAPANIELVPQPAETMLPGGLTRARFARGSRKLRDVALHAENDHAHMNADFGRLYLGAVIARLDSAPLAPEPAL